MHIAEIISDVLIVITYVMSLLIVIVSTRRVETVESAMLRVLDSLLTLHNLVKDEAVRHELLHIFDRAMKDLDRKKQDKLKAKKEVKHLLDDLDIK